MTWLAALGPLVLLVAAQEPAGAPRDPRSLPVAEEGRWADWSPRTPVSDDHRVLLGAGMAAYGARDYPRALDALYDLLELEPDFPPALYQASTASFRLRRYGDCIELLERFVRVVPREVGATQALGHSLYSLGRYEEARAHYERVLAHNPDSVEAVRGYGLSHLRLGGRARGRAAEALARIDAARDQGVDVGFDCYPYLKGCTLMSSLVVPPCVYAGGIAGAVELLDDPLARKVIRGIVPPEDWDDVPLQALLPAFMLSELKTAFQMGFVLFIPFLIIDMVVASVLMSMGMMMLPPVLISLPFKILLFVLVDGWFLIVKSLVQAFQ